MLGIWWCRTWQSAEQGWLLETVMHPQGTGLRQPSLPFDRPGTQFTHLSTRALSKEVSRPLPGLNPTELVEGTAPAIWLHKAGGAGGRWSWVDTANPVGSGQQIPTCFSERNFQACPWLLPTLAMAASWQKCSFGHSASTYQAPGPGLAPRAGIADVTQTRRPWRSREGLRPPDLGGPTPDAPNIPHDHTLTAQQGAHTTCVRSETS